MKRAILLALTNPRSDEVDQSFNEWYNNQHLADVVPGVVAAQRFRVTDVEVVPGAQPSHRYLAVYEVEDENDVAAVAQRVADAQIPMDPSLDVEGMVAFYYEPISERVTAEDAPAG
jgi:hypothetical protein